MEVLWQKTELMWLAGHLWQFSRFLSMPFLFGCPEIFKALFWTLFKYLGRSVGSCFFCVLLGTTVGGADTFPDEIVPCSFAWRQLCPALKGVFFHPPWCEILGFVLCHFGSW